MCLWRTRRTTRFAGLRRAGVVSTYAGTPGVFGNANGPAAFATFFAPFGLAVDTNGAVYVGDYGNGAVRKIAGGGLVSTLASGFAGPGGLAVDLVGNVYVADRTDHAIYKVTSVGAKSLLAGTPGAQGGLDGVGSAARFSMPWSVALDGAGNLYVADLGNNAVRKIAPGGLVTTLAGALGTPGHTDGVASLARFDHPYGVTADPAGNVFVVEGASTLRQITPSGMVSTVAGIYNVLGTADGVGSAANFDGPVAIAADAKGNLFISDGAQNIRQAVVGPIIVIQPQDQTVAVTQNANFVVTALGTGPVKYQWWFGGNALAGATNATLTIGNAHNGQAGGYTVVVSNIGNVVTSRVAALTVTYPGGAPVDPGLTAAPHSQTIFAGSNVLLTAGANGTQPIAYQWLRNGVALTGQTNYFLALTNVGLAQGGNYQLALSNAGGMFTSAVVVLTVNAPLVVTTFAGQAGIAGTNNGARNAALFKGPFGVALDTNGNVYTSDSLSGTIRKITPAGVVSTIAGSPGVFGNVNAVGGGARFASGSCSNGITSGPTGLAMDGKGNLYVADGCNGAVRKLTPAGGTWIVTTLASGFNIPVGVAVDAAGVVYVADAGNAAVYKVATNGAVSLLAGHMCCGSVEGVGADAGFFEPTGIAVDAAGNVFVADQSAQTVRMITPGGMVSTVAGANEDYGFMDGGQRGLTPGCAKGVDGGWIRECLFGGGRLLCGIRGLQTGANSAGLDGDDGGGSGADGLRGWNGAAGGV